MLVPSVLLLAAHAQVPGVDAPDAEAAEQAPMTWGATEATYRVTIPTEGPLEVELQWRFRAVDPAWMDVPLAGRPLVVQSVTGPAIAGSYGLRGLLTPASDAATITVRGTLDPSRPGAASLSVLPAARQRVIVDAPGLDVTVAGAKDGWLSAADTLALTWRPHVDTTPVTPPPLAHAEASTAVWAEPGALLSRAAVRWRVVRGEIARFELDVTGLDEVEVDGPNLARAVREGNRMVLTPRRPVKGTFAVDVRARKAISGDADVPAPAPRPIAPRVERYWTVGRAEDGELVPVGGPRAVAARELPEWARGLSDTPPESFWQGDAPLRVRLARFTPLMGPDTVIERAELVVAAAAEGRALVRTTWHTRNERRQYLHVRPAPGLRPMTARVSGEPVSVLSDGAGGVYVPLEKSVETVQGLLTFPVELTWIAEGEAWAKKGERTLTLPAVDAPIQAADWEVYLPRGWTTRDEKGRRATAEEAPPPPPEPPNEEAEEALQQAVSAYKSNKFVEAQQYLETARSAGSTSANVDRLQSNLDVLLGSETEATVEDVATRRVRELANAKTVTQQVKQEEASDKAWRALQSGDIDEAEKYLEEVVVLADEIGVTEQKESAEQSGKKAQAVELLKEVAEKKAKRKAESSSWSGSFAPAPAAVSSTITPVPTATETTPAADDGKDRKPADANAYGLDGVNTAANAGVLGALTGNGPGAGGKAGSTKDGALGALGGEGQRDGWQDDDDTVVDEEAEDEAFDREIQRRRGEPRDNSDAPVGGVEAEPEAPPPVNEPAPTPAVVETTSVTLESRRVLNAVPGLARTPARRDARPEKAGKAGRASARGAKDTDQDGVADQRDVMPVEEAERNVRYDPRTEIDFEGLDVSGELVKPQAALVVPQQIGGQPPATGAPAAPPPALERRAELEVKAAPLTLAMPLDGELVRDSAALLPADAHPTLTLPYRQTGAAR